MYTADGWQVIPTNESFQLDSGAAISGGLVTDNLTVRSSSDLVVLGDTILNDTTINTKLFASTVDVENNLHVSDSVTIANTLQATDITCTSILTDNITTSIVITDNLTVSTLANIDESIVNTLTVTSVIRSDNLIVETNCTVNSLQVSSCNVDSLSGVNSFIDNVTVTQLTVINDTTANSVLLTGNLTCNNTIDVLNKATIDSLQVSAGSIFNIGTVLTDFNAQGTLYCDTINSLNDITRLESKYIYIGSSDSVVNILGTNLMLPLLN